MRCPSPDRLVGGPGGAAKLDDDHDPDRAHDDVDERILPHAEVEQGTHEELLALNGRYAELYQLQMPPGQPTVFTMEIEES